jgi:uncharacterized membrane protein (UPF0182 family)
MRVPPARRNRERRFRIRPWMVIVVAVLVALFLSARSLAGFYTDYLWFDSVGFGDTWRGLLWARFAPAAVFTIVFFVMMYTSLTIADRLAPRTRALGPEDEMLARYQQTVAPYSGRIRIVVSILFALLAGASVSGEWQRWILFTHAQDFGIKDPQFHLDVGFYVFRLPFLSFVFDWLFAGLIVVLVITALAHYLNGGIRLQTPFQRVTPQVKAHLSVILALMALVKTVQYFLARYELDFSTRGVVEGASKTDVAAQLPALNLLMVISVVAAGLFVWNIWRRGWVLPVIAVGLWGFVSLVIGTIVPAVYQRFFVQPNELAKEKAYIARNINATRDAFGLDAKHVKVSQFDYRNDLTKTDLQKDSATIENARLWDPSVIASNYQIFQSLQTYYRFLDADTDRYTLPGEPERQVLIAARELNRADLPSQSWVNRHVVYTHGYGAVVSPANAATSAGQPDFLLSNVPGTGKITLDRPQVYFGEKLDGYTLVDAKQREFDYAKEGRDATTRYRGADGVGLSSFLRRAAFALRFGDQNLVISSQIDDKTRIMFRRDITERVKAAAPFLSFDGDPYPVISKVRTSHGPETHLLWVFDGFTTSNSYPYSQSQTPTEGGVAGKSINYIRNSVKATVDAYDGTVKYYVVDTKDPIIKAYRSAFPELFTDFSKMDPDLRRHLRYPQDLFRYQTDVYRKYHITNPTTFFSGTGFWEVSADPATAGTTNDVSTVTNVPQDASSSGKRIEPLYVLTRLPGQTKEEFLIIRPFVPVSQGNSQNRLASFMVARADPGASPRLESLEMPDGSTVSGPVQVNRTINTNQDISSQFTLLSRGGSSVLQGSIQIIPIKDSLLYIQPVYVLSQNGQQPQLSFVIVFYDGKTQFGSSVEDALAKFPQFQGLVASNPTGPTVPTTPPTTPTTPTTPTSPPSGSTNGIDSLLNQASALYNEAQTALQNKDLATYQAKINQLGDLIAQIQRARQAETGGSTGPSASSSTTTTTRARSAGTQAAAR